MYKAKITGTILAIDCSQHQSNMTRRQIVKLVERHPKYENVEADIWQMMNHQKEELRELEREIMCKNINAALYEVADMANCLDKINTLLELERA
jgi:hypothetical protein